MNPEDKIADAAYKTARATVDAGEKIATAIDRNTEAMKSAAREIKDAIYGGALAIWFVLFFIMLTIGCPRAKAAPLVSDGDEIGVGTVQEVGR